MMNKATCSIVTCENPVRIKSLGYCQKHETRYRNHGDPNYKSLRKSIIPLSIPGGEVIWDYQKARKILTIVSNIEKMIMCGYIQDGISFNTEINNQIGDIKYSKKWFYDKYIKSILEAKDSLKWYYPYMEDISNIVNEIIEKEKVTKTSSLSLLDLESFGIKSDKNEFSFIDKIKDLQKKYSDLKIDSEKEEVYEICSKLKVHYNRYKKLID